MTSVIDSGARHFLQTDIASRRPIPAVAEILPSEWGTIHRGFYRVSRVFSRFVRSQALREVVLHPERAQRSGGYLLACTHLSHIEPLIVTSMFERPVYWMARLEFYRYRFFSFLLGILGAFSVNRQGVPVSSIRTAIRLTSEGKIVGIFPEGGCVRGAELMFRGGRVKHGVCAIACRAQVPVLPVVVLGTDKLNAIDPWLPALQGRVWIAFGRPVFPPALPSRTNRRAARQALAAEIRQEYIRTYRELLDHAGLSDSFTP